jgi:hypothetical protein
VPNVLAVDPGLTTGYVLWKNGKRIEGENKCEDFLKIAVKLIESKKIDYVVCERFIISAQTAKFSQAPWSLEQIGVLRYFCERYSIPFTLQNVSDAKRFATEERLKQIKWKRPKGGGHARDAQRHLLLFLVKNDMIDDKIFISK